MTARGPGAEAPSPEQNKARAQGWSHAVNLAEKIRELDRRRQAFQALIESGRPRRLRDREEAFEEVIDRRIDAEEVVDEALVA